MQRIRSLLLIGAAVLLTGCSTYVKVVSDPEGATITTPDGSVVYGIAPLDVEYKTSDLERDLERRRADERFRAPARKISEIFRLRSSDSGLIAILYKFY